MGLDGRVLGYYNRVSRRADQPHIFTYDDLLVKDTVLYFDITLDEGILHDDGVFYNCAFFDADAAEKNRVFNLTFINTAVSYKRVGDAGALRL